MSGTLINMIEIGNTLVSLDIIEESFLCDLHSCHGSCCVNGDSGAPLEDDEIDYLEQHIGAIKPFLRLEGIESITKNGVWVKDIEHEQTTPLVNGKECAFVVFEDGKSFCGIERAWEAGVIRFQKPISCHLYPIRIKKYKRFEAVNYDRWEICKAAILLGQAKKLKIYEFLKTPLIRKYGEDWYKELSFTAEQYLNRSKSED